jgi:tetratricopeptide (TPR) repeat protein
VRVGSTDIDIPPGDRRYRTTDEYELPADVELLSIYPHAHLLAREVRVTAELPDGVVRDLLRIDRWDFAWQDEYRYVHPPRLPKGTRVRATFVYDNSAGNPANPFIPPRRIVYGPQTSDEMGDAWLQVLVLDVADRRPLLASLSAREIDANIRAYQRLVRARPTEAEHRIKLGSLYASRGDPEAALEHFREALRIDPRAGIARFNLAVSLQGLGRRDEAERLLRELVGQEPAQAEAWHALGHLAEARGARDEAQRCFERALGAWPAYADAHNSLANLLARMGAADRAEQHYRQALEAVPDHLAALNNLAVLLARRGAVDEAIQLLERAVEADPSHEASRQNLAVAREMKR